MYTFLLTLLFIIVVLQCVCLGRAHWTKIKFFYYAFRTRTGAPKEVERSVRKFKRPTPMIFPSAQEEEEKDKDN